MTTVIVTACAAFGLTVSDAPTRRTRACKRKMGGEMPFTVTAAGQVYKQTVEFVHLGGTISANRDLSVEEPRRIQRAWACIRRYYKMEMYERPGVRLRLRVWLLRAEVLEDAIVRVHHVEPEAS